MAKKKTEENGMLEFMEATYRTCLLAGVPIIPEDTAARLLAVLSVHGNNEYMCHSPKFITEMRYIQERFSIKGAHVPDPALVADIRMYVEELEAYLRNNPKEKYPAWAREMFEARYGIKLIN